MIKTTARMNTIYNMHECIRTYGGDEAFYMTWILVVPDEPSEYDFLDIALDNDDYNDVIELFSRLVKLMIEDDGYEKVALHLGLHDLEIDTYYE